MPPAIQMDFLASFVVFLVVLNRQNELLRQMLAERLSGASECLEGFMQNRLEGVKVSRTILEGQPAEAIVKHCGEQFADLVVLPTRGRNPLRHFILGSVTAKVLHESRCAVLTGVHLEREFEFPQFRIRGVLCAVDLGPRSDTVIRWAGEVARESEADLTAIHVTTGRGLPEFRSRVAAARVNGQIDPVRHALEQLLSSASLSAEVVIRTGEPHKQVSDAAVADGADLVVIGRGTEGGLLGRLRAIAYAIIRESPCPVLSI